MYPTIMEAEAIFSWLRYFKLHVLYTKKKVKVMQDCKQKNITCISI